MLNVIIGRRDGKMWKFHWDGKTMTPFTEAEMEIGREAWKTEWEKRAADIFNSDSPKPDQK